MKFAKELDEDAVPEWRDRYLDYRQAKKKLKLVARAVRHAERGTANTSNSNLRNNGSSNRGATLHSSQPARRPSLTTGRTVPVAVNERSPLRLRGTDGTANGGSEEWDGGRPGMARYGSIIGSPPREPVSELELPDPALPRPNPEPNARNSARLSLSQYSYASNLPSVAEHASQWPSQSPPKPNPKRTNSLPVAIMPGYIRRLALRGMANAPMDRTEGVALEAYHEADFRRAEFFLFLDASLMTIEQFYKEKEDEATERLNQLREQLHIMRSHRAQDIADRERRRQRKHHEQNGWHDSGHKDGHKASVTGRLKNSVVSQMDNALDRMRARAEGRTSKTMLNLGTPSLRLEPTFTNDPSANGMVGGNRDYERRLLSHGPSYHDAKRKLKGALCEFYRGLELLKNYALLNRKAFRKINKKYDKTVHQERPNLRYVTEKVDTAHFTTSDIVDAHIQTVEDLYARYFERGNHKVAVGKLRARILQVGHYSGSMFRTVSLLLQRRGSELENAINHSLLTVEKGTLAAAGIVLAILGLIQGIETDLRDANPVVSEWAAYLLQIYAGYFLMLILVAIFCVDARSFTKAKVNYIFIFEFDVRNNLNWRQLAEMPAVFAFLLGLVMYLNFFRVGGLAMYTYWPVILIGLSAFLMFLPAPLFYSKSRQWLVYSMQRLFFSGLYPVEFRDFFLGDMFCSLTYAMGNIELFFCLYARHWNDPPQCNSSNSRLFGFFTTLPGIWRAAQCVRRFKDTFNVYPHLFNCAKYCFTILSYMTLSLYRISKTDSYLALFIVFSTINCCFCIFWDIFNDWSLGNRNSKYPFLRDHLAYRPYWYYIAIVLDAIIRCNWIFYVLFRHETQHSSVVSFAVALSEVLRRGFWTIFRVENEHIANVRRRRAARDDVPLPYELPSSTHVDGHTDDSSPDDEERAQTVDLQIPGFSDDSPVARALRKATSTIFTAHAQDYQRKPMEAKKGSHDSDDEDEDEDDDDEDDEDDDHSSRAEQDDQPQDVTVSPWRTAPSPHVQKRRRDASDSENVSPGRSG